MGRSCDNGCRAKTRTRSDPWFDGGSPARFPARLRVGNGRKSLTWHEPAERTPDRDIAKRERGWGFTDYNRLRPGIQEIPNRSFQEGRHTVFRHEP
jgi:hypothetical protein